MIIDTAPPVTSVLSPAFTATRPPVDRDPLPTKTLTLPLAPDVADPERNVIIPLVPVDVVPEVKDREPDTPAVPAFPVRMLNAPLDVTEP